MVNLEAQVEKQCLGDQYLWLQQHTVVSDFRACSVLCFSTDHLSRWVGPSVLCFPVQRRPFLPYSSLHVPQGRAPQVPPDNHTLNSLLQLGLVSPGMASGMTFPVPSWT